MESGENKKLILAVDIGNTTIAVGIFNKRGRLLLQTKFLTHAFRTLTQWEKNFNQWLKNKRMNTTVVEVVVICSVVPKVTHLIKNAFHFPKVLVVGKNIKVPISNRYRYPQQVGQDRLVNAYAGYTLYGGPLILVDFGTAVTFDVVSKRGDYLGGLITPGLELARDSLAQRTALLPRVTLRPPKNLIGRTTQESILSGLFHGYGRLTTGIIIDLKKKIGPAKVIATGGDAKLIHPFCKGIDQVDPHLTLKGLQKLYVEKIRK